MSGAAAAEPLAPGDPSARFAFQAAGDPLALATPLTSRSPLESRLAPIARNGAPFAEVVAPQRVLDGARVVLFRFHAGSESSVRFRVDDGRGRALTAPQVEALLDAFELYGDDGSLRFEEEFDNRRSVADLGGASGSLVLQAPTVESKSLFAVATFARLASAAMVDTLRFTLELPGGRDVATPVIDVNDMPVAMDDRAVVLEDSGAFTGHVLDGSLGGRDLDEEDGALEATLVRGPRHGGLLRSLHADGRFTYVPKPQWNGTDSFTYRVSDGLSKSNVATVTLTVLPINDPPSFEIEPRLEVAKSSGAHEVERFAHRLRSGPLDELDQALRFSMLDVTNPALFVRLPRLDGRGTLRFTLREGAAGVSTVTAVLRDDGGLRDGGVDTSGARSFVIEVSD